MNLITLRKKDSAIELLADDNFDIELITANAEALFAFKWLFEKAMNDFLADYSAELDHYQPMLTELKAAGAIGYPVTPAKDARLYAADRRIPIETELEINCE